MLRPDDLKSGQHVAIHSWLDEKKHWLGDALRIKAICLPYLIVKFITQEEWPSITLDSRQVNLMAVSREFVEAQAGGYPTDLATMLLQPEPSHDQ